MRIRHRRRPAACFVLAAYATFVCATALGQGSIIGLGDLPGGEFRSLAYALSGDGTTVVGSSAVGGNYGHAFRWTQAAGMVDMGAPLSGSDAEAQGVSRDGSVIVGNSYLPMIGNRPWRWTAVGGFAQLPNPPYSTGDPAAHSLSGNGLIAVGYGPAGWSYAVKWVPPDNHAVSLPWNIQGEFDTAYGASADGSVIVGTGSVPNDGWQAKIWTAAGVGQLEVVYGHQSSAYAVSANGKVVVGWWQHTPDGHYEAFWWTSATGMIGLGHLPGDTSSEATGVSADGAIVVGVSGGNFRPTRPFIWDSAHGMRPLTDFFAEQGVAVTGWKSLAAPWGFPVTGDHVLVSDDGTVFAANGMNADNKIEAWIATVDYDGDGLLNSWETRGIDVNGDGSFYYVLPGANPRHKDVYVEVDAMDGLAFDPAARQLVIDAFAAAPNALVHNPDGADGVTLHMDLDETGIPAVAWPANPWPQFQALKAAHFGTPGERASPSWDSIRRAKAMAYRYCVFAHSFGGKRDSGQAEFGGNDFMITFGTWDPLEVSLWVQAGTFMHELGHTLGLTHGGDQFDPGHDERYNYKPNYFSVMNYIWQTPHAPFQTSWRLDYSRSTLPTLDETAILEPDGIGQIPVRLVPVGPPPLRLVFSAGPVDWNRDGTYNPQPVAADINYLFATDPASPGDRLTGFTDWSHLKYNFRDSPYYANGVGPDTIDEELTQEIHEQLNAIPPAYFGDLNCDGLVDFHDIDPFVLALSDPASYKQRYPYCDIRLGDINRDSVVDFGDIDPFVALLSGG